MPKRVIIIGGGLAGIAASSALTQRGFHTLLIDRRGHLGGRATSFHDPATGQLIDNCQHVLLGCCTNLLHLYRQLGVADQIEFFDRVRFVDETGRSGAVYATALPSPFHLGASMLRFGLLSLSEKFQVLRAMMAMKLLGRHGRDASQGITFETFLRDHGQSPRVIERFWNVLLVSALNEDARHASAKYGIQLFQEAFLGHRDAYRMAVATTPLAVLYDHAPATELLLGTRVVALTHDNGRITGIRVASPVPVGEGEEEGTLPADHVILAAAPDAARRILADSDLLHRDPHLGALEHLGFSPIIGAHFWYDRPVMDMPHLALVGTHLQWLFRKDAAGCYLHGVVSAATSLVDTATLALSSLFDEEIRRILPSARDAALLRSLIIKEKRATFRPLPGIDAVRPPQATTIPGLTLAGDYTRTDWPATMEGAVRSGYLAAEVVLKAHNAPARILQPDLITALPSLSR